MLEGAVTIGSLDGRERRDRPRSRDGNILLFGMQSEEVEALREGIRSCRAL
jgi:glucan phosphorylase